MKTPLRVLVSLAVAVALVLLLALWSGLDWEELARAWGRISWSTLLAAFALYAVQYALRAERFRVLVPPASRPSFGVTVGVTAAYGMATLILPAKVGEATFVLYLHRVGRVAAPTALAALVIARLLDFASLFLGFGMAAIALGFSGVHSELAWLLPLGAVLVLASFAVFALSARGDLLVVLATRIARWFGLERFGFGRKLLDTASSVSGALRASARDGRLLRAALLSLPMWTCVFAFCAVLGRGFGLPDSISFASACFGASLAILTSLVPISAFANFGTLEAGWVLGFGIFGVSRELALATGAGLHVVQLAFAVALGLLGHLGMGMTSAASREPPPSSGGA